MAALTRRRAVVALVTVVAIGSATFVTSCGQDVGAAGGYELTAHFERTVGLYPHGDVTLMGLDIGQVDDIVIEDTGVRVEMTIDADVPLPADVQATIESLTLIGERNVVLYPPWNESMADEARAADGDVIPLARTSVPVEPDEGLEAFNDLARSLDPDVVSDLVAASADVLEGRGESIGTAIDNAAALSSTFAEIDGQIVSTAEGLHDLAGSLTARDEQLKMLVDSFAAASSVLADEREAIRTFLASLVTLTDEGTRILEVYGDQLPDDIAHLAALASVLERNSSSVEGLFEALPGISEAIASAYQPDIDGLALRASATPTLQALTSNFRALVADLLGAVTP